MRRRIKDTIRSLIEREWSQEHAIGRMKKFKIMGSIFRNRLKRYDDMTSIVSGLINFRAMMSSGFDLNEFVA